MRIVSQKFYFEFQAYDSINVHSDVRNGLPFYEWSDKNFYANFSYIASTILHFTVQFEVEYENLYDIVSQKPSSSETTRKRFLYQIVLLLLITVKFSIKNSF